MSGIFLKLLNLSISASWLVLVVLALRLVLKRAPKWVNVLLWGMVALRLMPSMSAALFSEARSGSSKPCSYMLCRRSSKARWHFLYFLPLPHQHSSLRPGLVRPSYIRVSFRFAGYCTAC